MLDEHPYLPRQLSVFYRYAHHGGEFVGRVSPRSET
jgi:CRISPR/Cas system endoribonuclease Cas6 (RAMP superfamily)